MEKEEASQNNPEIADVKMTDEELDEVIKRIADAAKAVDSAREEDAAKKAETEAMEADKNNLEEVEEIIEEIVYGCAVVDGVALSSKALVNATEDFPIVLIVGEDFIPVKEGDEIKTPYDAVLPMDMIQKIGPMIRVIYNVEPMTNIKAIQEENI